MRRLLCVTAIVAASAVLAACGDDRPASTGTPGAQVSPAGAGSTAPPGPRASDFPAIRPSPTPTLAKGAPFPVTWRWDSGVFGAFAWPVVAGGSVYVSLGPEAGTSGSGAPGAVVRLAADSGEELWRFETPSPALRPTLSGDTVVAGSGDGTIYGLAASDGHDEWRVQFPGVPAFSVAADGGVVIVSDADPILFSALASDVSSRPAGRVWALDAATGGVRWRSEIAGTEAFAAADGDVAVVAVNDANGATVAGLDVASGREFWRDTTGTITTPPVVDGRTVILAGERLEKRDIATGSVLWSVTPEGGSLAYWPAIFDDAVVVSTGASSLQAFGATDGAPRWSAAFSPIRRGAPVPMPFVAGGRLYLQQDGIWTVTVETGGTVTVAPGLIPQGPIQYLDVADGLLVYSTSIGSAPTGVLAFRP